MVLIILLCILLGLIVAFLVLAGKKKTTEKYVAPQPTRVICNSTFPGYRPSTNPLALSFIKELQKGDMAMIAGYYVDLDPLNPSASFANEIRGALSRGATIMVLTDPSADHPQGGFDNAKNLAPLMNSPNFFWVATGTGTKLQSHIKLLEFFYFSRHLARCYFGSYNPFSPTTAEAGVFIEGDMVQTPMVRKCIFRDFTFLSAFSKFVQPHGGSRVQAGISKLLGALQPYSDPLTSLRNSVAGGAMIEYAGSSPAQCVGTASGWSPSVYAPGPVAPLDYFVPDLSYGIALIPESRLQEFGVEPRSASAKINLLKFISRAQQYIKIAVLYSYLSNDNFFPTFNPFQKELALALRDAMGRGVTVFLYSGMKNAAVDWTDSPNFSRFISFMKQDPRVAKSDRLQFVWHPAYSLHFKFYVSERDTLISNNMPTDAFYQTTVAGSDIVFYECPEINAYFDNLFNAFFTTFSDTRNPALNPAVEGISGEGVVSSALTWAPCGLGSSMSPQGCCLPDRQYPFQSQSRICQLRFVPSYVENPDHPANFFKIMLNAIQEANDFIILLNEFVQLGSNPTLYGTLDTWLQTPMRKNVNAAFFQAFKDALGRGVKIYIGANQKGQDVSLPDGKRIHRLTDTLSPSLKAIAPLQVFTVDLTTSTSARLINSKGQAELSSPFVHDKLYITDKCAYVGGQNWYPPLETDAGLLFLYGPIYFDLLQRARSILGLAHDSVKYTRQDPYQGAFIDLATGQTHNGSIYMAISPEVQGGENNSLSVVEYGPRRVTSLIDAYLHQLKTAEGDVTVCSWTISPVEFFAPTADTPYYIEPRLIEAIRGLSSNPKVSSVLLVFTIHSLQYDLPDFSLNKGLFCEGKFRGTGAPLTLELRKKMQKAYQDFFGMFTLPKVSVFFQGMPSDRVPRQISSCNLFHAKVIASDTSLSASSANFTPGYFYSSSNTGVVIETPGANHLGGFSEFLQAVGDLKDKKCEKNCGAFTGKPCLWEYVPSGKALCG